MNSTSIACDFPPGTRYFSLDGVLYAHAQGDHWYTINSDGGISELDSDHSPGDPTHAFTGDRISEPEFLAALEAANQRNRGY